MSQRVRWKWVLPFVIGADILAFFTGVWIRERADTRNKVADAKILVKKALDCACSYALDMAAHPMPNPDADPSATVARKVDPAELGNPPPEKRFGFLPPDLPRWLLDHEPGRFARAKDNEIATRPLIDPFTGGPFRYARGKAWSAAIVISAGPDGRPDIQEPDLQWVDDVLQPPPVGKLYDPTNGITSSGDIAAYEGLGQEGGPK